MKEEEIDAEGEIKKQQKMLRDSHKDDNEDAEAWNNFKNDAKKYSYTIPNEFIDQCPRCRYKFEYKTPLVTKCYCGSCTAEITEFHIRILLNNISREEAVKIYEGKLKYSKKDIESIKHEIENRYTSSCELALEEDDEEPRNIFETFNVDDLDRLIDFEDDEDEEK
jgi:hypothetical protein